jgi:hypothetical protein
MAIPGEGRIRESEPTRRPFLQVLPHTLDRGWYLLWGRGRRGGMRLSPVSSLPICRHPPPRPASGLLPRPRGGRWQSWRYPGKTASGRANPRPAFSPGSPHTLDRGDISTGVGQTGGACASLLSLVAICRHLRNLASIWRPCPPCLWLQYTPTPPGLWPPPPPPGGAVVARPRESRIRGVSSDTGP